MKRRRETDSIDAEPTVRETARPTSDVLVEGFCRVAPPPSTVRELNFDEVDVSHGGRLGPPHHSTKRQLDALLEPPAALAPFLTDPSLLPKRPPCARPS